MRVDPAQIFSDLIDDGRLEEAEEFLRFVLEQTPDYAPTHSLRALVLRDLGRRDEAMESAEHAARLDPRDSFVNWAVAVLLEDRNRYKEAMPWATTARDLNPRDPANWSLLAQLHAHDNDWTATLEHSERALELDPGHEVAANLRALALRYVDSDEAWDEELGTILEQYPASGWARAGQGWRALEKGSAAEAQEHFEQAYALDPSSEYTRIGLAEALKAQNPVYRRILRVLLWFQTRPAKVRWGIIAGGIIGYGQLRRLVEAEPAFAIVAYPLMAAWVLFILSSWLAQPLSDFILSMDERGRDLVHPDDRYWGRAVAYVFGTAVVIALAAAAVASSSLGLIAMACGFGAIPVAAIGQCAPGWPRKAMLAYTTLPFGLLAMAIAAPGQAGSGWAVLSLLASAVGSWVGTFLTSRTVRS